MLSCCRAGAGIGVSASHAYGWGVVPVPLLDAKICVVAVRLSLDFRVYFLCVSVYVCVVVVQLFGRVWGWVWGVDNRYRATDRPWSPYGCVHMTWGSPERRGGGGSMIGSGP